VPGPAQLMAFFLHPRKGMNVGSRRCNLRIRVRGGKENSPERAEHSHLDGLFDSSGVRGYRRERIP